MIIKGHAAIVTGGGSGLGAATASELAKAGAKVALLDVNMDAANAHAQKIGGIAIKCDVSDAGSAEAAIKEANAKHGVARILVNCAGIGKAGRIVGREGPMPLGNFEQVIKVNLIGSFNTLRLCATSSRTAISMARQSGSTARCAWRRDSVRGERISFPRPVKRGEGAERSAAGEGPPRFDTMPLTRLGATHLATLSPFCG